MPQRVTIWWTDEQERVLRMRAEELGLTVSQLIRRIFDKELQTGGTVVDQGWRAGFAHGYSAVMVAVNTAIRDVERRMQAGEIQVPQAEILLDPLADEMNG